MKSRTALVIGIILLILGVALFTFFTRNQQPAEVFQATVHRDCAPWDGSAFTVQIPWQNETVIDISIWQAPEITLPKTFSFPDTTGQAGNAILILPVGNPEPLSGTVFFSDVDPSATVEGRFDLKDEAGNQFKAAFRAEWRELMMLCG